MFFYHRTTQNAAKHIMRDGFRDGKGYYLTEREWSGVWVSDRPLDKNEGACGDTLLEVLIDADDAALADYEWIEEGKCYREGLVPAWRTHPQCLDLRYLCSHLNRINIESGLDRIRLFQPARPSACACFSAVFRSAAARFQALVSYRMIIERPVGRV
jgi:hypothetical protein